MICDSLVRVRPSQVRHLSLKDAFNLSPSDEFLNFAPKMTRLSQPNSNPDLGDKWKKKKTLQKIYKPTKTQVYVGSPQQP